jgi:histidine ammonia-lyase
METHYIDADHLSIERVGELISDPNIQLALSEEAKERVQKCRQYLDQKIEKLDRPIYGINTGFGSLYNKSIDSANLEQLQENLVKSHACGTGNTISRTVVKTMLLLKIQGLSYGHSGVQLATIERLIEMYNKEVLPVIYEQGSLGASGDLAPLAHLSLPLIGEGEVWYRGRVMPSVEGFALAGIEPIRLRSKEGLALLNGTQFMSALGVNNILLSERLLVLADLIGALSLEAYDGRIEAFYDQVHLVRKHPGQLHTAQNIRFYIEGSEIIREQKVHVQDPYSFRCMPQVHGASKDAFNYVFSVFENEINSVTDNPTIFPDDDLIVSAGNFHGQPLALATDQLSIAMAEIGNISERRTYKMLGGQRDLPAFLVKNPGLNSGFMIPQYTAASIVSMNKQLCTPSSVDSISSSNGQEDHVSMGANGVVKTSMVLENVERILAIELLSSAQALEFRRPMRSSDLLEELYANFRKEVPFVDEDQVLYPLIEKSIRFIRHLDLTPYGTK